MLELMCEVMSMCVKITNESKADCFFEYEGHVHTYTVRVYPEGWPSGFDAEYIANLLEPTEENLKETKRKLKRLAEELGVEV